MSIVSQVAQAVNGLPKWAQVGGQMADDPLVARIRSMIEVGLTFNPDLEVESLFYDMLTGNAVAYEQPKDADKRENLDYAPVTTPGEFWVIYNAQRDTTAWELLEPARPWPAEYRSPWAEEVPVNERYDFGRYHYTVPVVENAANEGDEPFEYVPSTSPWVEFKDDERSTFIEDYARARRRGKKWAKSTAFLVAGLKAFESGGIEKAMETAWMVHHAEFPNNILRAVPNGLMVRTTEKDKDGNMRHVIKLLRWEFVDAAIEYMWPSSVRKINALRSALK